MFRALIWGSAARDPQEATSRATRWKLDQLRGVPEAWSTREYIDQHVGIILLHARPGAWNWEPFYVDEDLVVAMLGLPVGLPVSAPRDVAERVLADTSFLGDVVPPFGVVVYERRRGRLTIAQDWLGMCRIFESQSSNLAAWSTRPSSLPDFCGRGLEPDLDGWSKYLGSGHFGGSSSPVRGVTLIEPGVRVCWDGGRPGGQMRPSPGISIDDFVQEAVSLRPVEAEALDEAASGLARVATTLAQLHPAPLTFGLSGGKDSRLVAASFIAGGVEPRFSTFHDVVNEGETASHLVDLLRVERGLEIHHELRHRVPVGAASKDRPTLLRRTAALLEVYDYQHPSSYLPFPSRSRIPPIARATISGAAGEIATGYWYPAGWDGSEARTPAEVTYQLECKLGAAIPLAAQSLRLRDERRAFTQQLFAHAVRLGLSGWMITDYAYLMERVRRWSNAAYHVGMVTPLLSREFVQASFRLPLSAKLSQRMHNGLIERMVPEWSGVPFVANHTGPRRVASVLDADGEETLRAMVSVAAGPLSEMLQQSHVIAAITEPSPKTEQLLQQYVLLRVAEDQLAGRDDRERYWKRRHARVRRREAVTGALKAVPADARGWLGSHGLPSWTPRWIKSGARALLPDAIMRWRYSGARR